MRSLSSFQTEIQAKGLGIFRILLQSQGIESKGLRTIGFFLLGTEIVLRIGMVFVFLHGTKFAGPILAHFLRSKTL